MSIIVQLYGGLANQLFQYAFGRSLAERLGTDFKLDISAYGRYYTYDEYELNHFRIRESIAGDGDMGGFVWFRRHNRLFHFLINRLRLRRFFRNYYREKSFTFDPSVFARNNTYFEGFWQTNKYFENIAEILRSEIVLKEPLSPESAAIEKKIRQNCSVSLHIRRYAHEDKLPWFGYCSIDYYKRAAEYLIKKEPQAHFFIFSDNYEWVKENFKSFPYPYTLVGNGNDKNFEDIILMSHCRHHIIANSTFSWWGAWLNPNPDKIVVAPEVWFAHAKKNDTRDLIPGKWVKM